MRGVILGKQWCAVSYRLRSIRRYECFETFDWPIRR